ncbi:MAG: hypothetical protein JW900_10230 [Anaerolineae bacterium]|nr:hypothetical protein [Anaerolineae bacterium]
MKRLVEFALEDGETILVEVETAEMGGLVPASRGPGEAEKSELPFAAALGKMKPAVSAVVASMQALARQDRPDEMQVEFGLKMSAQAGAVVAAGDVEANYRVRLIWRRDPQGPASHQPG